MALRRMNNKTRHWMRVPVIVSVCFGFATVVVAQVRNGVPVTVTMKSSHTFEGRVSSVLGFSSLQVDPGTGGEAYRIDDGLRRVYVSKYQIVPEQPVPLSYREIEFDIWQDEVENKQSFPAVLYRASPFNESGHRVIRAKTDSKQPAKDFVQGITKITPCLLYTSPSPRD